jgi:hypothetical protein
MSQDQRRNVRFEIETNDSDEIFRFRFISQTIAEVRESASSFMRNGVIYKVDDKNWLGLPPNKIKGIRIIFE